MVRPPTVRAVQFATIISLVLIATVAGAQGEEGAGFSLEITVGGADGQQAEPSPALREHLENLNSEDPVVRLEAVRALGTLADPAAVEPLIRVAQNDPRPEIRGWAVRALHRIGTPGAIAVVRQAAENDEDERVRGLANQLVPSLPPEPTPEVLEPPFNDAPPIAPPQVYPEPPPPVHPYASGEVTVQPAPGQPPQVVLMPPEVNQGQPYMPVYPQRPPGRGLRVGGWILFGTSYFVSLMAGIGVSIGSDGDEDACWPLMIPLVGPAILGAQIIDENQGFTPFSALAIVWSLVEVAGLTMAVAGHIRGRRARRQAIQRGVALVPSGPGGPGMSLAGRF